jgi:hypothetical protein
MIFGTAFISVKGSGIMQTNSGFFDSSQIKTEAALILPNEILQQFTCPFIIMVIFQTIT